MKINIIRVHVFLKMQVRIEYRTLLDVGDGLPGGPGNVPAFEVSVNTRSGQSFTFIVVS